MLGWLVGLGGLALAALLGATRTIDWTVAGRLAVGSLLAAMAISVGGELRARDRIRAGWLERLHQLTEDLQGALDSSDPERAVREAGERASSPQAVPGTMEQEREAFMRSVADQCAQAYQRVELDRARHQALADLELLGRAAPQLAASLDVQRVTDTIERLVVPALADTCELRVVHGGAATAAESDGTADGDDGSEGDGRRRTIPLTAQGRVVGVLEITRNDGPVGEDDLASVGLLAEPAARALVHALRYSDEVHTSATLQDSLLPKAILPIPGLEVATRYLAATEGQAVGGDFYDVVRAPSGTVTIMVGDVQGKGIEAAALTSTARHTMRSAALEGASPADMLRRVNDALLYADQERRAASGTPSVRFVTVAVVALVPEGEGFSGLVSNAGHPPPLVIHPDGRVDQIVVDGPLLGIFDDASFTDRPVRLDEADMLVLYTDGVTERRRHPELFDEVQLGRLVRNQLTARGADAVAQLILDTVVELSPRDVRDDIALVVARVTGTRMG